MPTLPHLPRPGSGLSHPARVPISNRIKTTLRSWSRLKRRRRVIGGNSIRQRLTRATDNADSTDEFNSYPCYSGCPWFDALFFWALCGFAEDSFFGIEERLSLLPLERSTVRHRGVPRRHGRVAPCYGGVGKLEAPKRAKARSACCCRWRTQGGR